MLMKMMKMTVNVMLVMMRTTKTMIAMLIPVAGAITVSTTGRRTATNLDSRTEAPMTTKNDGPCNCDGYHEKTRKNNNDSIQASLNAREREREEASIRFPKPQKNPWTTGPATSSSFCHRVHPAQIVHSFRISCSTTSVKFREQLPLFQAGYAT